MFFGLGNVLNFKLGTANVSKIYLGANDVTGVESGYDIFLVAGQSNSYHGEYMNGETIPNATLDSPDADIFQIGRFDGFNNQVILAEEPLDHMGYLGARPPSNTASWALTFAKMYKTSGYLLGNRKILLVPAGEGGTGFSDNQWNPGNQNYNDAVARVAVALAAGTGVNQVKGILWNQGERDCGSTTDVAAHKPALMTMIDAMRTAFGDTNIPFVVGGMVPGALTALGVTLQAGMADIPNVKAYTGYADPMTPTELTCADRGPTNHYSIRSTRGYPTQDFNDYTTLGLAGRYWVAYLSALTNT